MERYDYLANYDMFNIDDKNETISLTIEVPVIYIAEIMAAAGNSDCHWTIISQILGAEVIKEINDLEI